MPSKNVEEGNYHLCWLIFGDYLLRLGHKPFEGLDDILIVFATFEQYANFDFFHMMWAYMGWLIGKFLLIGVSGKFRPYY